MCRDISDVITAKGWGPGGFTAFYQVEVPKHPAMYDFNPPQERFIQSKCQQCRVENLSNPKALPCKGKFLDVRNCITSQYPVINAEKYCLPDDVTLADLLVV